MHFHSLTMKIIAWEMMRSTIEHVVQLAVQDLERIATKWAEDVYSRQFDESSSVVFPTRAYIPTGRIVIQDHEVKVRSLRMPPFPSQSDDVHL